MSFPGCSCGHHLEFLKKRKIGERNKLPLSGWARNARDDDGDGGGGPSQYSTSNMVVQ